MYENQRIFLKIIFIFEIKNATNKSKIWKN